MPFGLREHLSGIPLRPLPDGKIKDGTNFSLHAMRAVTFTMNSRPASFESFDYIAVGKVHAAGLAKTRLAKSVLDAGWSSFRQHTPLSSDGARGLVRGSEKFTSGLHS